MIAVPEVCQRAREDDRREHVASCASCQAFMAEVEAIGRGVDHFTTDLDDLARARIEAGVLAALAAPRRSPWRARAPWMLAPLAAAAALVAVTWAPQVRPAPLSPRLIAGFDPGTALRAALLGGDVEHVVVPEGGRVALALGAAITLEAEGAAELWREGAGGVRLERGRVLVDVASAEAARGRVIAGAIAVEAEGARFSVERAADGAARVAVARGRVRVRDGGGEAWVEAGAAWPAGALASAEAQRLSALRVEPLERAGVLELAGPAGLEVRVYGGATLGTTPLWVALPAGQVALEIARRGKVVASPIAEVREGTSTRLQVVLPDEEVGGQTIAPPAPQDATTVGPAARAAGAAPTVRPAPRAVRPVPSSSSSSSSSLAEDAAPLADAEAYYRRAEGAMARRDRAAAARSLEALITRFPADPLVSSARYELARLAIAAGEGDAARRHLDALLGAPAADGALIEPARFLSCTLVREADAALACWTAFRAEFVRSPHDREALVELARWADRRGGCVEARPYLELLVGLYPGDVAGHEASARLVRCRR